MYVIKELRENFDNFQQYSEEKYKEMFDKLSSGKNSSAKLSFGISFLKLLDLTGIPIGTTVQVILDALSVKFGADYKPKFKKLFDK